MKIENLTVGMRIRNYQDLCILIEEKICTGKSKQLQVQKWEQYFRYHRDGNTFIIDEIYKKPLPPPPRKLRSDNIYTELIEIIMIDKLLSEHSIKIRKVELYRLLGFCNDNYANTNLKDFKNIMQQFQDNGITGRLMTVDEAQSCYMDFSNFARNKFNDILMSALESMQRRNLIIYRKTFLIVEEVYGKHITRDANKEEECEILELISGFLKNNPQYYHINTYMIYAYYAELNKWIRKNKKDWFAAYPVMCITINDNQDDISRVNKQLYRGFTNDTRIGEKKLELNRIIIERFNKHFSDEFKKAKNNNRVLQEDWIQWGESNKMNSEKFYPPYFQEAQSSLVDLFIKIEVNDTLNQDDIQMEEFKMNTNIKADSCAVINTFPVLIKEYHDQRVVTFKDIDTVHGRPEGTARKRFNDNKKHFIEGEDYYIVTQPSEIRTLGITRPQGGLPESVILITETGYFMISKSFRDDLAWTVQRQLVNTYFKAKEIIKQQQFNQDTCYTSLIKDKISKWKRQVSNPLIERLQSLLTDCSLGQTYACIYREMKKNFDFDGNTRRLEYSSKYNIPLEECAIIDVIAVDNVLRKQFLQCLSSCIRSIATDQVKAALEIQENCLEMITRKEQHNSQFDSEFDEISLISECNCKLKGLETT